MNMSIEREATRIYGVCKHVDEDGISTLWPVGKQEDHLEVCTICKKVVCTEDTEEYPEFSVNVPVGG
jgi:hypothetical protein